MEVVRAYDEIFNKAHDAMAFDSAPAYFHTLDAPVGAFFPFGGTGPDDASIQRLLLRKTHNGLHRGLLTQLQARKVGD